MKRKIKHKHNYGIGEFYRGSNHVVAVAILICQCGDEIWEELFFDKQED